MPSETLIINCDGGARGNPGPAACGFSAQLNGKVLAKSSKFLGIATNNIAEYQGVVSALEWLKNFEDKDKVAGVHFLLDSQLVVNQINGIYKVKNQQLLKENIKIKNLIESIDSEIIFESIPRNKNKVADQLVNEELDSHLNYSG